MPRNDTFDCRAAFCTGAIKSGKVRVIWKEGTLRTFNETGKSFEIKSQRPTRKPGHRRTWVAVTQNGEITISEACWTCGGWWKIASRSAEHLWGQS